LTPHRFKAAAENNTFEWFFLLVDAGKCPRHLGQSRSHPGVCSRRGSSTQLRERVEAGIGIGFVNAAEVTMARSAGVPVKTVAAYFGQTTAADLRVGERPIKSARDLDGKRIGSLPSRTTSYRTVLYMNISLP